ncbi:MAG: multidrug effflux MFS transporter [Granulosicoccus sp.]|nr:multidrug effflux MFS transporter [Granulosicoccus sp.]
MILPPLWLLVVISAMGPIVMNGVLPANSQITRDLLTTYGMAQMVLTVYLLATLCAQIVLGNWADRYGRRPIMIGSLLVFALGGIICALAPSIEMLLLGRFIQGLGSSVCIFLPRTIIRDVFPRDRAASVIGYMTTAMMVAPLFGPAVGGWITDVSSWRLLYAVLGILGILLALLCVFFQNETLQQTEVRPVGSRFVDGAVILLRSRAFRAYLAVQCGSVGIYYAYLGGAPYVLMELYGLSAFEFGRWFAMIAIGYLLGNLVAGRFSQRFGGNFMISLSIPPLVTGIVLFWLMSRWQHPFAMFFPMQLVAFSNGICLPNVMSATMSVRPDLAGSASGLAGTFQTAAGIIMTIWLSAWLADTSLPLLVVMTGSLLLAVTGYVQLRNPLNRIPDDTGK